MKGIGRNRKKERKQRERERKLTLAGSERKSTLPSIKFWMISFPGIHIYIYIKAIKVAGCNRLNVPNDGADLLLIFFVSPLS